MRTNFQGQIRNLWIFNWCCVFPCYETLVS